MSGGCLFYTVFDLLSVFVFGVAFEKHVPLSVGTFHNVIVDTSVLCSEKYFRFAFKTSEILVGVCIICDKAFGGIAASECEVYHVFLHFRIIDGLRCPDPMRVVKIFRIIF